MKPTTHILLCPGCQAFMGTLTLERPRLPWWDDYFCRPCGENPAINRLPSPELRAWVLALRELWIRDRQAGARPQKVLVYNARRAA